MRAVLLDNLDLCSNWNESKTRFLVITPNVIGQSKVNDICLETPIFFQVCKRNREFLSGISYLTQGLCFLILSFILKQFGRRRN